ncbi:MAG TPA: 4-alpha-glucanotransferase [Thermoanaerobaculia bacterium]|jgi:4-alpha-glucanotransferase|nr:4-alpha-glucanotransferase [Thermoanaerobaculia bacterium]
MTHTSVTQPNPTARAAGVLLHPTSLPGRFGIGDLGDELLAFLDWAQSAGLRIWQVLPLNAPGYGNSPYGCLSSYAGNPLLISPRRLVEGGLLPDDALEDVPEFAEDYVEFDRVNAFKQSLLRQSFEHFSEHASIEQRDALAAFIHDNAWLPDWTLYAALKEQHGCKSWTAWTADAASRDRAALADARLDLADELRFHEYVQWLFFAQWAAVREAADARGIRIMGDVPIYVAGDSADVWANREIFQLDERGEPTVVAGVPPDYFSATGQRWGNPLYRWDVLQKTHFRWWISRFRAALRFADIVRVDHFRGFAAYWEIPAAERTAIHGRWVAGPGRALFDALRDALGELPLVAEDLGHITNEVHELREAIGVPGMKILQFAFAQPDSPHLPHCYDPRTVVYTGTHDNDTARGWYEHATAVERETIASYLGVGDAAEVAPALVRAAYTSVAETAIVPVQDVLNLGSEARMNRPGAEHDNWSWRVATGALTAEHAEELRELGEVSGRS